MMGKILNVIMRGLEVLGNQMMIGAGIYLN